MLHVSNTAELWRRFAPELLAYLRRRLGDEADAQDVLQEVFVKIHRNLDKQPARARLAPWVFRIAKNALADHYRSRRTTVPWSDEDMSLGRGAAEPPPHEAMEQALGAWLRGQVEALPEPYRTALVLTELEGLSQREGAARLELPYSTFKSQVHRGRERLGQALARCCRVELDAQGRVREVTPTGCGC